MFKRSLVVWLVLALALVSTASAQHVAQVAVVGADDVKAQVGQEFTVPVWINGVSNLYGADVRLAYDPAALAGVRVNHGNFLRQPWWVIRQGFWTWPGDGCGQCAWYALTQLRPALPQSGSGVLVYVTFRALRPGVTNLGVSAQLSAAGGVPIAVTTRGATVTVGQ